MGVDDPLATSPASSQEQPEDAGRDKTPAWNTCPTCGEIVDVDDDSIDGAEMNCSACNAHLVLAEYVDDTFGLVLADEGDADDPEDDPCPPPEQLYAELTPERLDELDRLAREDQAAGRRATARPWKWWTANSRRELRSEVGRLTEFVAFGQQHPIDHTIDIAIQEPDMALIERAVNGLEERASAVLALSAQVRRLREENARMRPVVEAAKAWSEDGTLAGEVALSKALGIWEPPRAEEERKDG